MMAAAALRPHKASAARVPTRCVAALCAACFLLGVCVVNRYWAVPEHPGCPDKAGSDRSRSALNQVSQTREVIMALDKTISDIEMRLAAARAAQAMSQGMSPGDSEGDQGTARHRMSFVMGVFTTFANRKRRDSIRQTWMPQGDQLRRLEEKGVVIRFVIGRSANPNPDNEVDRAIDAEDKEYNDILRINHVEGYGGLPMKIQMFLSTALTTWDADFYVKADDNVHVNIGITRSILARHRAKPRVYIGCMKSGPVIAKNDSKYYEPDHWKFGTEGNNYFRHATRQLYAVTRDLATYISANRHILHKYSNEDVSFGSWLIGLEVEHVDERSLCCGTPPDCEWKAQAGNPCAASFDWNCTGICNPVERMTEVHRRCWEGLGAEPSPSPLPPLVTSAPTRGECPLGSVVRVRVRVREFEGGAQQRRLIGLLGGGAMAMDDAVAEADLADPNPDVGDLFHHYDGLYFRGALAAAGFTAQWRSASSPPLSRSFGSCTFSRQQNTITLSESFLKYRSCTDRKNALLHEMIHAIIYVKFHRKDRNHGPTFRAWMEAINKCRAQDRQRPDGGYSITTRHDFIPEEPHSFKGMVWKCRSCGDTLLRAINQGPPSDACCIENDDISASCGNMLCYWHNHKDDCSGTYEKTTMLKLEAPSQKKAAGGAQLLLTLPSEMSKSKGAIQESSSSILQLPWSTKATKPNTEDKHLCLGSGSNGKPQGSSSSKKADKRRRPEMVGETSVMPAAPQGKPNQNRGLVATVKQAPVSVEGYNDAKSLGRDTSKKAGKRHKPDDLQKTSVLPSLPQGTPKLKHALVATENNKLSSAERSNNAKSPITNTSKKAGEQHELQIAQKACSQPANPQKRLKQDPVAPEKKELSPLMGCSNEKLLDRSSSKKAYKQHEPEDIQETPVLSTAPGIKPMASVFVASEKQRKGKCKRKKPVKEKEYAVMSAWLNFYESDRSSGSPEPLVNKRTERRRRERERAIMLTYSRSKKIKTEPSVNSGTYASVSSHRIEMAPQDGSMQQSRPPSPCSDHAVGTTANQVVVTPATGDQSQPSAPRLDVVPFLQPADPLTSPDQSNAPEMIVISDDD